MATLEVLYGEDNVKKAYQLYRKIERAHLAGRDITPYLDEAELMGIWATIAALAVKAGKAIGGKIIGAIKKRNDDKKNQNAENDRKKLAQIAANNEVIRLNNVKLQKAAEDKKLLMIVVPVAVVGAILLMRS